MAQCREHIDVTGVRLRQPARGLMRQPLASSFIQMMLAAADRVRTRRSGTRLSVQIIEKCRSRRSAPTPTPALFAATVRALLAHLLLEHLLHLHLPLRGHDFGARLEFLQMNIEQQRAVGGDGAARRRAIAISQIGR